jgi:hypothetical protein
MNDCKNIAAALVKAQRAFGPALKDKTNPAFRSKYADLGACLDAVMDSLNAAGIALIQRQHPHEGGVCVETVFLHESGEQLSAGLLTVPAAKQDPQGYGSALTYARRYSVMAACGIAPEDDDGNAATKPAATKPTARTPDPKPEPVDMSPKARADRMRVGVASGDAAGVAQTLAEMPDEAAMTEILALLPADAYDKVIAAWPGVTA